MSSTEPTVECEICDSATESFITTADGYDVCDSCQADLIQCDDCGDYVRHPDDMRQRTNGNQICEGCADTLDSCCGCGDYGDDVTTTQNGNSACDLCLYARYFRCDYCDEWINECDYCENDSCNGGNEYGGLVNDYDYKPSPRFHGTGRLFMGFELEVNYADYNCAELATNYLDTLGYLKEDCSLSEGFEIVTHPMTHAYARESFPWELLRDLRDNGADPDRAGLHVHVNRSAFDGPAHIYRWLRLIYRNENALTVFSRRDSYAIQDWAAFDMYNSRAAKEHAKGSRGGKRHAAVNVTNSATFEVRLFAASLDREDVQAALDFVAASVEYTRNLTVPVVISGGWSWSAFREWVSDRPEYAALAAQMAAIDTDEPAPPPARHFVRKQVAATSARPMNHCPCSDCQYARSYARMGGL